ncbi:MAG: heavy-metal-associated domain-containing protein [Endomicrobiales bacterium]
MTPVQKETIAVSGMHCAGCARNVERSVKGTKGVKNVDVNLEGGGK